MPKLINNTQLIDLDLCEGSGAEGGAGRVADTTAAADGPLHHHVPAEEGPAVIGGPRFHVREESAPVQAGAAGVRELRLNRRRGTRGRFTPWNGVRDAHLVGKVSPRLGFRGGRRTALAR